MGSNPGVQFVFHTMRTNDAVAQVLEGKLNLAIVRTDTVEEPLLGTPVGSLDFSWVVPRNLLPGKSAAGVHLLKELPLALLAGDGKLAKAVIAVAAQNQIKVSVKVLADSFGLIIEAVRNGNLAAVLPTPAASNLLEEHFTLLELDGMNHLRRNLSLVYDQRVVAIRDSIKRVAGRLVKVLVRQVPGIGP